MHLLYELLACPVQAGQYRALFDTHGCGYFFSRISHQHLQYQWFPIVFVQFENRLPHIVYVRVMSDRYKRGLCLCKIIDVSRLQSLPLIHSRMFPACDRQKPRLDGTLVLELIDRLIGTYHSLLHDIIREYWITAQPSHVTKEIVPPRCYQPLETQLIRVAHALFHL